MKNIYSTSIAFLFSSTLAVGCSSAKSEVETGAVPDVNVGRVAGPLVPTDKLDLLFMIDNSASMGDKQELLSKSATDLVRRLVEPRCVDSLDASRVLAPSHDGACTEGLLEFQPIRDIHIGIISSSLGGLGSDACAANAANAHHDDQAHLLTRGGADEHPVRDAEAQGFLTFLQGDSKALRADAPATVVQDVERLISDVQELVTGVHESGCGFEAQLESVYRFLIQPDPYATITRESRLATLHGVDETILRQRRAFLRPDSAVAVVMLTDENDSAVDPSAVGRQAWAFEDSRFLGSSRSTAPRGTATCAVNPNDESCTSCAMAHEDPSCSEPNYRSEDDDLNVRFFHMKSRFGIDPQFPISRYVAGLSAFNVPDRTGEHALSTSKYIGAANCTNPLFASDLPMHATDDLCHLPPGPRVPGQVFFVLIGGVTQTLLPRATGPLVGSHTPLTEAEWTNILGRDPLAYDFTGADPHMLESIMPRAGIAGPNAPNDADPVHGREYDSNKQDLQYACTFQLPIARDCSDPSLRESCACDGTSASPVCDAANKTLQVRAGAYPSVRQLAVAKALGSQAVVSSICADHVMETVPSDPLFAYRPAFAALVDRMSPTFIKSPRK
jgi:hypothetical protein